GHVSTTWAKSDLDGIRKGVDASLELSTRLGVEDELLCRHGSPYFFPLVTMASKSLSRITRYSSPSSFTSVPAYLAKSTESPTWTSISTRCAAGLRVTASSSFSVPRSRLTRPFARSCSSDCGNPEQAMCVGHPRERDSGAGT